MAKGVKVNLDGRDSATFEKVKAQIGVKSDADVFRFLMTYYGRREGIISPSAPGIDCKNIETTEAKTDDQDCA